jgi:hypothetical protein
MSHLKQAAVIEKLSVIEQKKINSFSAKPELKVPGKE